jgi:hypothetical protein
MNVEARVTPDRRSLGRTASKVFAFHLAVTLALGYIVVPQFDSMTEPPPRPSPVATVLAPLSRIFYFPIVSWAASSFVTGYSRPGIGFVIANSALVALALSVACRMATRFGRAVA